MQSIYHLPFTLYVFIYLFSCIQNVGESYLNRFISHNANNNNNVVMVECIVLSFWLCWKSETRIYWESIDL